MRKIKIIDFFADKLNDTKITVRQNKKWLWLGLTLCGIGLLLCLFNIPKNISETDELSLIGKIEKGGFSPFLFEIKIIFYIILPILVLFILSINYYLFLLGFCSLIYASFLVLRYIIKGIIADFFTGLLSAVFVIIPISAIVFFGIVFFVINICDLIRMPCRRIFTILPYSIYFRYVKKHIINYLLFTGIPCFIYSNLAVLITYLICNA